MLYIVLILVLAALGLLVTALITANSLWAWVSILLSVLAGLMLVVDFVRRRSARRRAARAVATQVDAEPVKETAEAEATEGPETGEEPAKAEPDQAELPLLAGEVDEEQAAETGDPAEEPTAPADVEAVAKLDVEVLVVDEYPRYHVSECVWLGSRETIPIAVMEARDLGFTPCARCTPDAKLVAAHRATSKSGG